MQPPILTPENWKAAEPHVAAALAQSPGMETVQDVLRKLISGDYQLWTGARSAAVTTIETYPSKKVLTVIHGGGDLRELLDVIEPQLCEFASAVGCSAVMGTGRKGWERPCLSRGYSFGWIVMHKELRPHV